MRILHFYGSTAVGGVASIVYDLSRYYVSQGHHVDQLSIYNDPDEFDKTGKFEKLGIATFPSTTSSRYSIKHLLQLRKIALDYDVVHVHIFPEQMYGAMLSCFSCNKNNPLIITTEHSTRNNRRNIKALRGIDRLMYQQYDGIVCISDQAKTALDSWLESPEIATKTFTITNGINVERFRNAENRLSEYLDGTELHRYIVMAARLNHPKDPFTLIKALKQLPHDLHVVFLGEGDLRPHMVELTRQLGLEERVHLLGNVPTPEFIYKGCSIGVLSTEWDGFGLVAAEYMAAGIPAVVSDVDGLKDVVGNSELLFETGDVDQLASILNRLLSNEAFYETTIQSGNARVVQYSSDKMGQKYLDLYNQLLKNKRKR